MSRDALEEVQQESANAGPAPKVSAIINTYNQKEYIGKAIRSALGQTNRPCEILVIDDGSTDGTEAFVRTEFGADVQYHYHANRGIGASRNAGVRYASGEWVAFLDSDDYWAPDKLESEAAAARVGSRIGMVASIGLECTPDGTILGQLGLPHPFTMSVVRSELRRRCVFSPSGLLIRRHALQLVGGFPEDLTFGEDLVVFARIAASFEIAAVHRPLFYKTQLPQSLSSRPEAALRDGLISFRRCTDALARRGFARWLDAIAFRQSVAQLYLHVAWLYAGKREGDKVLTSVLRGLAHWPFLTMRQYHQVYWLFSGLLRGHGAVRARE